MKQDAPEQGRPVSRNVTLGSRRTSVRLEPVMWQGLADICAAEEMNLNQLVEHVDQHRGGLGLTAALRVFIVSYFRRAAGPSPAPVGFAEDAGGDDGAERDWSPTFREALRSVG
ncbi:MAG TPA: ribbon-helix-helix domain-containing protein [Azospirillaceae bacterium]|nr:ribbon-helix-helix domain-containing protein [Azospirillaceae bacterium]